MTRFAPKKGGGTVTLPKSVTPIQNGKKLPVEHPRLINAHEEHMLKLLGGAGAKTKFGVKSYYEPDGKGGITAGWSGGSNTNTGNGGSYSDSAGDHRVNGYNGGGDTRSQPSSGASHGYNAGNNAGGGNSNTQSHGINSLGGMMAGNTDMAGLRGTLASLTGLGPAFNGLGNLSSAPKLGRMSVNDVPGIPGGSPDSNSSQANSPPPGAVSPAGLFGAPNYTPPGYVAPTAGWTQNNGLVGQSLTGADPRSGYYDKNGVTPTTQFADRLREELQLNGLQPNDKSVAAMMGSLQRENLAPYMKSGSDSWNLDSAASNGSFPKIDPNVDTRNPDGSPKTYSWGAAQWNSGPGRMQQLGNFFSQNGLNPNDPNSQAAALAANIAGAFPGQTGDFKDTYASLGDMSQNQATQTWMRKFENPAGNSSLPGRQASANQFARNFPAAPQSPSLLGNSGYQTAGDPTQAQPVPSPMAPAAPVSPGVLPASYTPPVSPPPTFTPPQPIPSPVAPNTPDPSQDAGIDPSLIPTNVNPISPATAGTGNGMSLGQNLAAALANGNPATTAQTMADLMPQTSHNQTVTVTVTDPNTGKPTQVTVPKAKLPWYYPQYSQSYWDKNLPSGQLGGYIG